MRRRAVDVMALNMKLDEAVEAHDVGQTAFCAMQGCKAIDGSDKLDKEKEERPSAGVNKQSIKTKKKDCKKKEKQTVNQI